MRVKVSLFIQKLYQIQYSEKKSSFNNKLSALRIPAPFLFDDTNRIHSGMDISDQ